MRVLAALACAFLIQLSPATAQDIASPDPRLAPMETHYARISQAYAENDPAMVLAYRTPDFVVRLPGGVELDYDNSQRILLDFFQQSLATIEARTEIQCAYLVSDTEANFVVTQYTGRRILFEDTERQVQGAVTQTETWRLTPDGWRLAAISDIRDGRRWVDGVEIDPSRPYDASAPAFVFNASAPVTCPASVGANAATE